MSGLRTSQRTGGEGEDRDEAAAVDPRIAALAEELATAINEAEASGQQGMRDLALEVVKDSVEASRAARAAATAPPPGAPRALNPFALGLPLLPVGAFMFFLFPPVGLVLFLAGLAACLFGLAQAGAIRLGEGLRAPSEKQKAEVEGED